MYQRAQSMAALERSIAVLPFEHLSATGEDTYFTVGMQDEITGDLAKLAGMKVIGSQSTRSYLPGKERNLHAIGRDLGVRHLLEGSVSRDNAQMRVALRLVDLRDSAHPWTETYQRPSKDIFVLQSEITRAVAAHLQRQLSPTEKAALEKPPTSDLQAYDFYLQVRALPSITLETEGSQFLSDAKRAISMMDEAVTRDPSFVAAYCELSRWHDELYSWRNLLSPNERTIDHRNLAEAAMEKARRLEPDSGQVRLTLARHALQVSNNLKEAEIQVELARQVLPNDVQVETIAARVARRKDRWDEAIRGLEKAVSLEPRSIPTRYLLANTYRYMRRYADYERTMEGVLALTPPDKYGSLPIERGWARFEKSGDLALVREALAAQISAQQIDESDTTTLQIMLAIWSHDADGISRLLSVKHGPIGWNGVAYPDGWFEALAARMRGDDAAVGDAFSRARPEMETRVQADPADALQLSVLAIIDAGLGRKEVAVEEGKKACELLSAKANNFNTPTVHCNLAVVYAWIGQNDLAIAELTPLINGPAMGNIICLPTYGDFRRNPLWDPLRNDPRFTAIMKRLAPVASK